MAIEARLIDADLRSLETVQRYLRQFASSLEPEGLLLVARQAFEVWKSKVNGTTCDIDEVRFGDPLAASAGIPFALGWAHAQGWLLQPDIDKQLDENRPQDVVLMRWEDGRCEALETYCTSDAEIDAVWSQCRINSQSGAVQ